MPFVRLDPAGLPFIGGALAVAAVVFAIGSGLGAGLFVMLAAFFTFFFRDPERHAQVGANDVVAPADGRVLVAGSADAAVAPPGVWQQISIFLSPLDVHVNRIPVSGRVTDVHFQKGRFLPAYHHDAATSNERSEIWIDHAGRSVVARQVVGVLARRVVCRVERGAEVRVGDRFGIMKFGSRMDVFVPHDASLRVHIGETVRGGETVIAVLH